jgi:hypothetical protein
MNLKQYAPGSFLPIIQHEIVEIVVPANSPLTRINFPDIQNLRDSNLVAIEFYPGIWKDPETPGNDVQNELVYKSPTGNYLANINTCKSTYLTLQAYNGVEFLHQSPILTHRYVNGSSAVFDNKENTPSESFQKQFSGQKVNWPKCYLERFDGILIPEQFSFLFSVYYYKTSEIGSLMGAEFRKQS